MADFLPTYLAAVPEGQRQAILSIIEQMKSSGLIATREQFDLELEKLVKALQGDGYDLNLNLKTPSLDDPTPVSSEMLNDNFQQIYVGLQGLFTQMNKVDITHQRHRQVHKSSMDKVKAATNKLLEDAAIYQFLKFNEDSWNEVKYSNLWNRRNANTTIKAAEIDERTRMLRLRIGESRRIHQFAGTRPTTITVEPIGGGQTGTISRSFEPDNALDNSVDTFWAHLVLADDPLVSTIYGSEISGAAAWVVVEFPNAEPVSTLELLPFGTHPVLISNLEYWDGSAWQSMPGWSPLDASLDWQTFGFEEVQTNKIRFVISQSNYTKNTYLVPRRLFTNSKLWEQVVDQELMFDVNEEELTGAQSAAVQSNPRFRALFSAMKQFSDRLQESGLDYSSNKDQELQRTVDAATRVMTGVRESDADIILKVTGDDTSAQLPDQDDMVEITKVEYLMGLRHLCLERRNHFPVGIYESPKFEVGGTVYQVGLDTYEKHVHKVSDFSMIPLTSIEYDIEVSPERRVPIVPGGLVGITQELVKIDPNTLSGRLRFTSATVPNMVVRKNGAVVTTWSHTPSTKVLTITSGFHRNDIYTVDYDPLAGQDVFDIEASYDSVALERPETFQQTDDNGMIQLSFYPYVAWEIINDIKNWVKPDSQHAKWAYRWENGPLTIDGILYGRQTSPTIVEGERYYEPIRVLVDGIAAKNITQYRDGFNPAFAQVPGQALVYQYIHSGRKIYFNRPIAGATIEVHYRWMVQYIKLVATLRGHQQVVNPYSPELAAYRLKLKTARL
jgi:hypothetical protein